MTKYKISRNKNKNIKDLMEMDINYQKNNNKGLWSRDNLRQIKYNNSGKIMTEQRNYMN